MRIINIVGIAAVALAGCGSSDGDMNGGADLAQPPDLLAPFPAPHGPPPQVANAGGPVLNAPVIVPVFFSNDDAPTRTALEDFASKLGATQYWAATTQEYGVGPATAAAPVELTETATGTIDDTAIQGWLAGKLNTNDPAFPAPIDNSSVYVLHYPTGVTVTLGGGAAGAQQSCQSFGAYHSNIQLDVAHGNQRVAYAVIPRCPGILTLTPLDVTTGSESHELVEAATDPYPQGAPAYASVDSQHRYWARVLGGGEVSDMCAQESGAFTRFPELAYTVQRSWSNAAALAGHDPCVPAPAPADEPYFNTAPELPDTIISGISMTMTPGVHVPVGTSKTIVLDLFADADTGGPWTVKVEDAAVLTGGTAGLTFALDQTTGQNGDKLNLTITTVTASTRGTATFMIQSKLGNRTHHWFGFVGEQ
jgi:hypothetical protein